MSTIGQWKILTHKILVELAERSFSYFRCVRRQLLSLYVHKSRRLSHTGKKLFIFSVKTENNRKWRNQKEEIHTRTDNPANSDHFSVSYPVFYEFSSSRFVILFIYCVLTWAESTGCSTQPLHSHGRNSTTLRSQQRIWHVDTFSANILTNWSGLFHKPFKEKMFNLYKWFNMNNLK